MNWDIDPDYEIPPQTNFEFRDYLFGHTWSMTWDGNKWVGNNVVNHSFNKQSTYTNNYGHPGLIVQHTDHIAKWINCFHELPVYHQNVNFATILAEYVTNWRVVYKDGYVIPLPDSTEITLDSAPTYEIEGVKCDVQNIIVKVPSSITAVHMLYIQADININGHITPLKWDSHPSHPIVANFDSRQSIR
ncbi:hypothetical protein M9Y10_023736 [Tritrichomonas musculus]|uniref:Uncharacterized protein n=1 Tax=Tritrichomonas musculus TaxID=1915356 RepID=A0ABR2KW27_9EUKA